MFTKDDGFTLLEMLVVLLIISVLILLFVPSLSSRTTSVQNKGCDALIKVVQAQVDLYTMEKGTIPNHLTNLVDDYISEEQLTCQNGKELELQNGKVRIKNNG